MEAGRRLLCEGEHQASSKRILLGKSGILLRDQLIFLRSLCQISIVVTTAELIQPTIIVNDIPT